MGSALAALSAFAVVVFATALIFGSFVRFNFHAVIYLGEDAGEKALLLRRRVFFLIRVFSVHIFLIWLTASDLLADFLRAIVLDFGDF
jgi:hypothetical protein